MTMRTSVQTCLEMLEMSLKEEQEHEVDPSIEVKKVIEILHQTFSFEDILEGVAEFCDDNENAAFKGGHGIYEEWQILAEGLRRLKDETTA